MFDAFYFPQRASWPILNYTAAVYVGCLVKGIQYKSHARWLACPSSDDNVSFWIKPNDDYPRHHPSRLFKKNVACCAQHLSSEAYSFDAKSHSITILQ